jgi:hypothetical protein
MTAAQLTTTETTVPPHRVSLALDHLASRSAGARSTDIGERVGAVERRAYAEEPTHQPGADRGGGVATSRSGMPSPGGYVEVPRRTTHTFRNEGEGEARTITGYDVPGFEKWFEEFGYDAEQPGAYEASTSESTLRRVEQESSRYHMILAP